MPSSDISQDLYFPSKRDWWVVALIWMGLLVSVLGGMLPVVLAEAALGYTIFVTSVILSLDALMLWVLYGTGYFLTSDQLRIRCGPLSFRVVLHDIAEITPTKNLLSSPACSLDRLKIVYGVSHQSIMISPVDKSGFLSAIVQQCPSLEVLHDRVKKKTASSSVALAPSIQPQIIA